MTNPTKQPSKVEKFNVLIKKEIKRRIKHLGRYEGYKDGKKALIDLEMLKVVAEIATCEQQKTVLKADLVEMIRGILDEKVADCNKKGKSGEITMAYRSVRNSINQALDQAMSTLKGEE